MTRTVPIVSWYARTLFRSRSLKTCVQVAAEDRVLAVGRGTLNSTLYTVNVLVTVSQDIWILKNFASA